MAAKKSNLTKALSEYRGTVMSTARCIFEATIDARQHLLGLEEVGEIESLVPGPYKLRARRATELHVLKRLNSNLEWRIARQVDSYLGIILAATDRLQQTLERHLKATGESDEIALASQEFLEITDFAGSLCLALDLKERPGLESTELLFECYEREDGDNNLSAQYCRLLRERNELLLRLARLRMEGEQKRDALWHMHVTGMQYKCFVTTNPVWRPFRTTDAGRARRNKLIFKRLDQIDDVCAKGLEEMHRLMREAHQIYDDACALIVLAMVDEGQNVSYTLQKGRRLAQEFDLFAKSIMGAEPDQMTDVLDRLFASPSLEYQAAARQRSTKSATSATRPPLSLVGRA